MILLVQFSLVFFFFKKIYLNLNFSFHTFVTSMSNKCGSNNFTKYFKDSTVHGWGCINPYDLESSPRLSTCPKKNLKNSFIHFIRLKKEILIIFYSVHQIPQTLSHFHTMKEKNFNKFTSQCALNILNSFIVQFINKIHSTMNIQYSSLITLQHNIIHSTQNHLATLLQEICIFHHAQCKSKYASSKVVSFDIILLVHIKYFP